MFLLSPGHAHDPLCANAFLPTLAADTPIADKAFDADAHVLDRLAAAHKTAMIPSNSHRTHP